MLEICGQEHGITTPATARSQPGAASAKIQNGFTILLSSRELEGLSLIAAGKSNDENQDLFWAVRGAGANFGIVTSFEFEVIEIGEIGWAQLALDASDITDLLEKWGRLSRLRRVI